MKKKHQMAATQLSLFPDSFIFECSMKKAMWQIGNAVPPRLAECLGYAPLPYFNDIARNTQGLVAS